MQQIGERTARLLKLLAGLERDEPVNSYVFALYSFLFLLGMLLLLAWIAQPSGACAVHASC